MRSKLASMRFRSTRSAGVSSSSILTTLSQRTPRRAPTRAPPAFHGLAQHGLAGVHVKPFSREGSFAVAQVDGELASTAWLEDQVLGAGLSEVILSGCQRIVRRHFRE